MGNIFDPRAFTLRRLRWIVLASYAIVLLLTLVLFIWASSDTPSKYDPKAGLGPGLAIAFGILLLLQLSLGWILAFLGAWLRLRKKNIVGTLVMYAGLLILLSPIINLAISLLFLPFRLLFNQ